MNEFSCTVLFGSPHSNGNCAEILKKFLDRIEYPIQIEYFDAYELNARPCIDCGYCKQRQQCVSRDIDGLYDAIESSDLLIIATPVYNMSFPSPLKAILDRFQRYYNARFSLNIKPAIKKHRKAVVLAVAGSEKETGEMLVNQLRQSFSVMNTELCAQAVINGLDHRKPDENDEKLISCAATVNEYLSFLYH